MKPLQRSYRMTDPSLTLKSQDVLDSIDRDITEFNARGFTPTKRTLFENTIAAFDAMPSDNYLLGLQEIATQTKNTTRVSCETAVNVVLTGVVNVWGIDSAEYHFFTEDKPLSQLSDNDFLRYLEDFADATEDELTALADEGIDAATVTNLRALRVSFNTALKNQRKAIKARDTGDTARIKKGNELNKLLVAHCNTGKNIWINVDESKYNDYVIYDTTPAGSNVAVREADVPFAADLNVDISTLEGTDESTITIEVSGTNLKFFSATTPGGTNGASIYEANIGTVTMLLFEFATLTGIDETRPFLTVRNSGAVPGHYKLTFTHMV